MTQQVLHLDFISLKDACGPAARSRLAEAASDLLAVDQVASAGMLDCARGSDFDLVFFFVLPDYQALEPFGTDPRYVAFLQKQVAPVLKSFAGADVAIEGELDLTGSNFGACIALEAPEETYDFEIREALQRWLDDSGARSGAVGLAVGEIRGYRGVALALGAAASAPRRPESGVFNVALAWGEAKLFG